MFRKMLGFGALAITLVFGVTGLAGTAQAATKTIRVAFNQPLVHPEAQALQIASKELEAATGGRYKLQIFPNATLGDQRATLELVQNGALDIALVANPLMENYNKDFGVLGLPYIFDSAEHQFRVFTSDVLDEVFASSRNKGFQVLAAYTCGARNVYTDKPIKTPADLKGYKIRVMQSDTMVQTINLMGGVGTPMSQGEVYTAIQQKVIEGGENSEITYYDLRHYEVAPFFSYTGHFRVADLLVASTKLLDKMSDEDRAAFMKVIKESVKTEFRIWDERMGDTKAKCLEKGVTFVDVDIKPFQENCKPLHAQMTASSPSAKKLYDAIRAMGD